jgi:hypothetical protein
MQVEAEVAFEKERNRKFKIQQSNPDMPQVIVSFYLRSFDTCNDVKLRFLTTSIRKVKCMISKRLSAIGVFFYIPILSHFFFFVCIVNFSCEFLFQGEKA